MKTLTKAKYLMVGVVLWASTGCYAYRAAKPGRPETVLASSAKSVVRLTVKGRVPLDVRNPQIVGDSVIGTDDLLKTRIAFPLSDVIKVQQRDFNTGLVVMTVLLAGLGAFILVGLAVSSNLQTGSY